MAISRLVSKLGAGSQNMQAVDFAGHVDTVVLAADTPEVYTVPAGATFLLFSATANFYARRNAAAAVPTTEITDGTGSELNPVVRVVGGSGTIGLVSGEATIITISAYS